MTESKPAIPTIEKMKTWDEETLLDWIQKRDAKILKGDRLERFKERGIDGHAFSLSSMEFFNTRCHLDPVVSLKLEDLLNQVKEKGKFIPRT
jgi:hypothetical protein